LIDAKNGTETGLDAKNGMKQEIGIQQNICIFDGCSTSDDNRKLVHPVNLRLHVCWMPNVFKIGLKQETEAQNQLKTGNHGQQGSINGIKKLETGASSNICTPLDIQNLVKAGNWHPANMHT
jgi:hypothetical protein